MSGFRTDVDYTAVARYLVESQRVNKLSNKDLAWELFKNTMEVGGMGELSVMEAINRLHPDFGEGECIWTEEGWDYENTDL